MPTGHRTALVLQTEHDGPGGLAADHLLDRGFELHVVQVLAAGTAHSDVEFPDPTAFDLVMPLGSIHSVYDTETIGSWIHREVDCIRTAHDAGVPVFGICFGAQVLCTALGGTVERSPQYELGWIHVDSDDHDVVPPGPWFSWHGDRCLLPDGVHELARNEVATQAFEIGRSFAVQFHPEVTSELVTGWLTKVPPSFFEHRGVDPSELVEAFDRHGDRAAANLTLMLDRFLGEHVG